MGVLDYFRPVRSMTTEEAREFMRGKDPGDYNLVDVRQPKEYERGHLAGSVLIPVGELGRRIGEIDASKPTITY
ncbi:MAG: rhodanese-like domain-containing protein [Nitrospirae bacterium]|nr:rhodanese-like domain-containing protein [Nitrospirota bacterium]